MRNRLVSLALLVFTFVSAHGMQKQMIQLKVLGNDDIKVFHTGKEFIVKDKNVIRKAHPGEILKKMSPDQIKNIQVGAGYLLAQKLHNGDYKVDMKAKLKGSGPGGATIGFHIGWWCTNAVCHAAIFVGCRVADVVVPGSGAAAEAGIHYAAAPFVAKAAAVVGCGLGIAGGVATGPA